jgi:exosortase A-associated hydrolase 1
MAGPSTPGWREEAVSFECGGDQLLGILTRPRGAVRTGLVILPGGMQYRVGAHRQNVLLARAVAGLGVATLRFEGRGMGDGDGLYPGFTALGPDLRAAIAALRSAAPGLTRISLYGLCDAATAIALDWPSLDADDAILVNPWVRSEQTLAAAQIRSHYSRQVLSPAFWRKLLGGGVNPWAKLREFSATFARSRQKASGETLADRLLAALAGSDRPLMLLLSDRDMTAAEFTGAVLPRLPDPPPATIQVARIAEADHTFSRAASWQAALARIEEWLAPAPVDLTSRAPARLSQ